MSSEADADAHVREGVFEDEVPADDPRNELAHDGVRVRVCRARDGDHAGELGVTEAGEATDDGDEQQRDGKCGTCTGAAGYGSVVEQEVDDGRALPIGDLGRVSADGCADDGEDSRADDDTDTQGGERDGTEGLLERVCGQLGVGDELVDGLCGKDLSRQGSRLRRGFTGLSRL
jgi:hypothetical protein